MSDITEVLMGASDWDIREEYEARGLHYEINIADFSDVELINELKERGYNVDEPTETTIVESLYENYRRGNDLTQGLRNLFWDQLGRLV